MFVRSQPLGDLQGRRSEMQRLLPVVSRSHLWAFCQLPSLAESGCEPEKAGSGRQVLWFESPITGL